MILNISSSYLGFIYSREVVMTSQVIYLEGDAINYLYRNPDHLAYALHSIPPCLGIQDPSQSNKRHWHLKPLIFQRSMVYRWYSTGHWYTTGIPLVTGIPLIFHWSLVSQWSDNGKSGTVHPVHLSTYISTILCRIPSDNRIRNIPLIEAGNSGRYVDRSMEVKAQYLMG